MYLYLVKFIQIRYEIEARFITTTRTMSAAFTTTTTNTNTNTITLNTASL